MNCSLILLMEDSSCFWKPPRWVLYMLWGICSVHGTLWNGTCGTLTLPATHSPLNQHNPSECQKHVCSLVTTIQTRIPTQSPMRIPTSRRCAAANTPRVMGANDERSWCKQRVQSWSGWRVLAGVWWVWWQSGVVTVGPLWGGRLEKSSGYFSC